MRQTTFDDALIGLISEVILQACDDYQGLVNAKVIVDGVPVGMDRLGRTRSKTKNPYFYRRVLGFSQAAEVTELIEFMTGDGLDFLCEVTGMKACRIRRKLGIAGGAR